MRDVLDGAEDDEVRVVNGEFHEDGPRPVVDPVVVPQLVDVVVNCLECLLW